MRTLGLGVQFTASLISATVFKTWARLTSNNYESETTNWELLK